MGKKSGKAKFDIFEVAEDGNIASHVIAWLIMGSLLSIRIYYFVLSFISAYDPVEHVTAIGLIRISNGFASLVIAAGFVMSWHALSHRSAKMRSWLKTDVAGFTPKGIMSGGFLPIPTMLSMGLLMFMTSTFVSESYVRGAWIVPGNAMAPWVPAVRCRWTSVEDDDWLTHWFGRFDRTAAVPSGIIGTLTAEGRKPGKKGSCYMGPNATTSPSDFQLSDLADANGKNKAVEFIDWTTGEGIVHPFGEPDEQCMYQCAGWLAFSLPTLITNIGSIGVGAAIVVAMTNKISQHSGTTLVDESAGPEMLAKLRKGQAEGICSYFPDSLKRSSLSCALKIAFFIPPLEGLLRSAQC
jgi:hypothetical protein